MEVGQMTDQPTPEDWVLIEAAKRAMWDTFIPLDLLQRFYITHKTYRALCDMIAKHEQPPVDRKLLCAREAWDQLGEVETEIDSNWVAIRAIELWEEGFGK